MSAHLRARPTLIGTRHLPFFQQLGPDEVARCWSRLSEGRWLPADCATVPPPPDGEHLFRVCQDAGLDHAGVVLAIAREHDAVGLLALEHLVGRPVQPWQPRSSPAPRQPSAPRAPRAPSEHRAVSDDRVVLTVAPNPKKPGSATHLRYATWRVGATVAEMRAAGLSSADVQWDVDRGFVVLGPPVVPGQTDLEESIAEAAAVESSDESPGDGAG